MFDFLKNKESSDKKSRKIAEDKKKVKKGVKADGVQSADTNIVDGKKKTKTVKTVKNKENNGGDVKKTERKIDEGGVLINPHITEKATYSKEKEGRGVYVFKINPKANKLMVKQAVKKIYGVQADKVNIINISSRECVVRRRRGVKRGYKKAMVYLKKGDKIEI